MEPVQAQDNLDGVEETLKDFMKTLWGLCENQPLTNPQWWADMLESVTISLEDQNTNLASDYVQLKKSFLKIISHWQTMSTKWLVTSFADLDRRVSALLGGTFQTLWSRRLLNTVAECWTSLISAQALTPEDYYSGSTKETTSTSSTTARTALDNVDASSQKRKTSKRDFASLYASRSSLPNSMTPTGQMFSYTSLCQNGKANEQFGLMEPYDDYRIQVKVYDGPRCASNPDYYWNNKLQEMDVTVSKKSQIWKDINNAFCVAYTNLEENGASSRPSPKKQKYYSQN
uniref:Nonstructural protein 2 n=1 Tax=Acheta domestica densovirus TaxID=185639 RepID=R9YTF8_9VIRU|nr:nonstructural protein 2 [Acheta domestica densovirus]AGO32189.1 nonstructural protein 2 [Acheta domestica densovirus]AGO32199.1 nonstructural protein 2 [Acheta domestica densovirus]AGO32204.1 nonstructural protein 2 [Acheta domestica densovirus]QNH08410.1 nonstructural protein 2 [Acheta domestica densovirus]